VVGDEVDEVGRGVEGAGGAAAGAVGGEAALVDAAGGVRVGPADRGELGGDLGEERVVDVGAAVGGDGGELGYGKRACSPTPPSISKRSQRFHANTGPKKK